MKFCRVCKQSKPESEFPKHGVLTCKRCLNDSRRTVHRHLVSRDKARYPGFSEIQVVPAMLGWSFR